MTKNEAIAIFKRAGYTFTGYKDAGWGEKRYHFTHPGFQGENVYDLSLLRFQAHRFDVKMWYDEFQAELKQGIQEELFTDIEIEAYYAIENPIACAS